jgi:putative tricarboxylic transport membrane protein
LQRLDRISSLFWVALSSVIAIRSYHLGIGSVSDPGPGFIFFYTALFIGLMAIFLLLGSLTERAGETGAFDNVHWSKVLLPFAYILLYALLLEKIGFITSTFLLMLLLLKTIEAKRWAVAIFVGLAMSLGTYAMFELWLHVRLPKGMLGF